MKNRWPNRSALLGPLTMTLMAAAWCAMFALPPLLQRMELDAWSGALRAIFSLVCHQNPARSFHVAGLPLAVCARCTGIYLGFLAGCLTLLMAPVPMSSNSTLPPSSRVARAAGARRGPALTPPPRAALLASMVPSALQALAEAAGLPDRAGFARALTGALFGFVSALFVVPAFGELPDEIAGEVRRLTSHARSTHAKAR